MPSIDDTQPNSPFDTQPKPPRSTERGPGCVAWALLAVAGGAFSIMVVVIAGLAGYLSGQEQVNVLVAGTQQAQIDEYLATIPAQVAAGNTFFIEGYIDWFAELTPPPPELPGLIATGTQLALDVQPTVTPTPTVTPMPTATVIVPTPTVSPPTVSAPTANSSDPDAPLFDPVALFAEAEAQMAAGEFEDAADTLDAVMAVDPDYRPDEVEALLLEALTRQAAQLLRSGDPANLPAGIIKANEAEEYGDIGDIAYERYIAGLYLNAQGQETTNPLGAIEGYSRIYAEAPGYMDVQRKIVGLRVALGDEYLEAFDFCPAAAQYQAALQISNRADIQQKLDTAQASCSDSGTPPANLTPGAAPTTDGSTPPPAAPTEAPGVAPIGER